MFTFQSHVHFVNTFLFSSFSNDQILQNKILQTKKQVFLVCFFCLGKTTLSAKLFKSLKKNFLCRFIKNMIIDFCEHIKWVKPCKHVVKDLNTNKACKKTLFYCACKLSLFFKKVYVESSKNIHNSLCKLEVNID